MKKPIIKEIFPTFLLEHENLEIAESLLPLCEKYTNKTQANCLHIKNFPSTLHDEHLAKEIMDEPLIHNALNFIVSVTPDDYIQLYWRASETDVKIEYYAAPSSPTRPAIPSVILTATLASGGVAA